MSTLTPEQYQPVVDLFSAINPNVLVLPTEDGIEFIGEGFLTYRNLMAIAVLILTAITEHETHDA